MSDAYRSLLSEIRRAQRLLLAREAERAGLAVAAILLSLAALALLTALVVPLYRPQYAALRTLLFGGAGLLAALAIARVWAARAGLDRAALLAGRLEESQGDSLLSALELGRELERPAAAGEESGAHYSAELKESAVRAAAERAHALPLGRLRAWRGRGRWLLAAGLLLAALALVGAAGGRRTSTVVRHILVPAEAPVPPVRIRVAPGNREVESGSSVRIQVFVSGTTRRPRLLTREAAAGAGEPGWRAGRLTVADDEADARPGEHAYSAVLPNLKEDLAYRVTVGDARTGDYQIRVTDLPRATGFRVRYEYPAYTGMKPEESQNVTGDLAAPRGTRARVTLTTNRNVASAIALFETSGAAPPGGIGERLVTFTLPVLRDDRYHVRLIDPRGRRVDLGPYDVRAIPDRPPTVTVLAPGDAEDVSQDMITTVIAGATDDYGVKRMLLRYRVREAAEQVVTLAEERTPSRELAIRYTWPLQTFSLLPGEEIEYAVGAVDADAVDGPQTTWSGTRRIRFPSASEILASMDEQHDQTVSSLEDLSRQARDLKQKAEEMARDIGRTREIPWEKQQDLQKTLEGQQTLREQVDKIAQQLSQDADKLAQSRALNSELVQKLNELHQLMSQLRDQSLQRSIDQLRQALQKMSPQEIQRALENFKLTQEDVIRNLERTIQLLKQAQVEERLEEASERAAEMERRQLSLNDSLARAARPQEIRDLARNEQDIREMSEEARAALDSLASMLQAFDKDASQQAKQLGDSLGTAGAQPEFEQSEQSLSQADPSASKQSTERLRQRLSRFRQQTDQMRSRYRDKRKNELAKKMETAARDLLEISDAQKGLLDDAKSETEKRAEKQQGLNETTESAAKRIAEMAKQTLFITPEMGAALSRAMTNQKNAVGRYSLGDLGGGLYGTKEATVDLNQAAAALLKGMESMASSSSASGFKEAMQAMQGLGEQQQSLNEETMGAAGNLGDQGRLVPDPSGELGRLAAQQEAIRRGLEEAMQKLGGQEGQGGGTLGRLGNVSEDMKQVVEELRQGRLEQQTLDRQQRILSRLLDAPRSVEKRDYSRQRTSRPGVEVVRSSPGALSPELLRTRPSLAALLAKGGHDPVSPKYRALVEEYFQALLAGKAR